MEDDPGGEGDCTEDGEQDADHGVANGELVMDGVELNDDEIEDERHEQQDDARQAEEEKRAVLAGELDETS